MFSESYRSIPTILGIIPGWKPLRAGAHTRLSPVYVSALGCPGGNHCGCTSLQAPTQPQGPQLDH